MKDKKIGFENQGNGVALAKKFRCTTVTVSKALNFKTDSALARKIRAAAMVRGGIEYDFVRGGRYENK